jgi:Holliday junction DNA helicase RuvB
MQLKALNVDEHGLDDMDNRILATIIDKFKGGPLVSQQLPPQLAKKPVPSKRSMNHF